MWDGSQFMFWNKLFKKQKTDTIVVNAYTDRKDQYDA